MNFPVYQQQGQQGLTDAYRKWKLTETAVGQITNQVNARPERPITDLSKFYNQWDVQDKPLNHGTPLHSFQDFKDLLLIEEISVPLL